MYTYGFGIDNEFIRAEGLASGLGLATVAEIKFLIDRLKLPIKKTARKAELVTAVTALLQAHPEYIVKRMSGGEISLVKRLLSGERIVGDSGVLHEFYLLVKLGWIVLKELPGSTYACELIVREEAERLLRPLIEDLTPSIPARIMQFVDGWAALCGVLPVNDIVSYIANQPGFKNVAFADVMDTLMDYANPSALRHEEIFNSGHGDIVYITPWTRIVGKAGILLCKEVYQDGKKVKVNVYNPKEFSFQEIIDASVPLFAPKTPNSAERMKVERRCRKYGMSSVQIEELLLDCWIEKQRDEVSLNITRFLEKFKFNSINDLNAVMGTITGYMNSLPFWRFLGQSSEEVAAKELAISNRPPQIVPGPNMRAMGMDIPEELKAAVSQMWGATGPVASSNSTVGRNDPCPCGSGKKYKKCCGK